MEARLIKYLKNELSNLAQCSHISEKVLTDCNNRNIITRYEKQELGCQRNINDRNYRFWKLIKSRVGCWEKLIQIFDRDSQAEVVTILKLGIEDRELSAEQTILTNSLDDSDSTNEARLSQYLIRQLPNLLELSCISSKVLASCAKFDILSLYEEDILETESKSWDRNYKFWRIILNKVGCWRQLTQIFESDDQTRVTTILKAGIEELTVEKNCLTNPLVAFDSVLETRYRECLTRELPRLVDICIISKMILAKCCATEIISISQMDILAAENSKFKQNYEFWRIINTRISRLENVIQFFQETWQTGVVSILTVGIQEYQLLSKQEILSSSSEDGDCLMETRQRDNLNRNLQKLTECSSISILFMARCCQHGILSSWDSEMLYAEPSRMRRSSLFWTTVVTRVKSCEKLIRMFKEERQTGVTTILQFGIPDWSSLDVRVTKRPISPGEYIVYKDDAYGLDPENIGVALVINITEYEGNRVNRTDTSQDFEYMKELWENLDYEVISYEGNFTPHDFNEIVNEFLDTLTRKGTPGSCVVFIGSHGNDGNIVLSDGTNIRLYEDFICKFTNAPDLSKKPKLFFVNTNQQTPEDGSAGVVLDKFEDTLICCCSFRLPTEVAYLEKCLASYFVRTLTEEVMKHGYETEIIYLLEKVCQNIRDTVAIPELSKHPKLYRGFKMGKLYFNLVDRVY